MRTAAKLLPASIIGSLGGVVEASQTYFINLTGSQIPVRACEYSATRGVLKKQPMAHLRTARQMRQAKGGNTKSGLGQIVDTVSIRERPAEAKDRAVPGHWEGDLLTGTNNSHIATLVERHTRS